MKVTVYMWDGPTKTFDGVYAISIKKVWLHIQTGDKSWLFTRIKKSKIRKTEIVYP